MNQIDRVIDLPDDWDFLCEQILADAQDRRMMVVLDGGSGAGKTQLALALRDALGAGIQLVHLDSCYPGWHGLAQASQWVTETILSPDKPGYPTWDWETNTTSGWVDLDPTASIIVEGCGALTMQSAQLASTTLFYDLDARARRSRALDRDGDTYAPWWDAWAAQEREHWERNAPQTRADYILRGQLDLGSRHELGR